MITIVGNYLSPYVRKVLAALELKGLAYQVDPIVPFFGDDRFTRLSPLRRIPVLIEDGLVLPDSTVICEYLDDSRPEPSLLPADPARRGQARLIEEFADSRLGDLLIWRLFYQLAVRPAVWGETGDADLVARTLNEDIPEALDWLETQAPEEGFLFGALGLADIAPACFFRNAAFVRLQIDPGRWPRTAAWIGRTLESAPFAALKPFEDASLRTPIAEHRERLIELGAPISEDTYATARPRRGVMAI